MKILLRIWLFILIALITIFNGCLITILHLIKDLMFNFILIVIHKGTIHGYCYAPCTYIDKILVKITGVTIPASIYLIKLVLKYQ